MNPDSLFLSYGDGRRTKNASVSTVWRVASRQAQSELTIWGWCFCLQLP